MRQGIGLSAAVLAACAIGTPAIASAACTLVDSFQAFMDVSDKTAALPPQQQIQALHNDYLARHSELYAPQVMPAPSDARGLRAMAAARAHPEWRAFDVTLGKSLQLVAARFGQAFPDFRCDFPVYATQTFGSMDGAGRDVAGRPALVFGVDTIAGYWTPATLPVFLSHELFHRYHFQAAGFSDDLAERDLIWRSLWAEGLATYVSARLNPSNPLSDALMLPKDLEGRARPFLPQMASELLAKADEVDARTFAKFFEVQAPEASRLGWPSRSGYYIGYLVACDLGQHRSLLELAHMKGPALRSEIGLALERLSRGPETGGR